MYMFMFTFDKQINMFVLNLILIPVVDFFSDGNSFSEKNIDKKTSFQGHTFVEKQKHWLWHVVNIIIFCFVFVENF